MIASISKAQAGFRDHQGFKSINHHGEFFRSRLANTAFHSAGMRPVRDSRWVKRHMAGFNVVSAHKIAIDIIEHLIAVDITVAVWRRNAF